MVGGHTKRVNFRRGGQRNVARGQTARFKSEGRVERGKTSNSRNRKKRVLICWRRRGRGNGVDGVFDAGLSDFDN